jgi:hypothetical protein
MWTLLWSQSETPFISPVLLDAIEMCSVKFCISVMLQIYAMSISIWWLIFWSVWFIPPLHICCWALPPPRKIMGCFAGSDSKTLVWCCDTLPDETQFTCVFLKNICECFNAVHHFCVLSFLLMQVVHLFVKSWAIIKGT